MASAAAEESPLETAQRLVRTVARAFYSDELVVMLDMLLRDRYLRDSTMDKRVGISAKLVSHAVVSQEEARCWPEI